MAHRIGICIGDVTGIGPEVTLKALARELRDKDATQYLLFGDFLILSTLNQSCGTHLLLEREGADNSPNAVVVVQPLDAEMPDGLAPGSPAAAEGALNYLREGARRCLLQELDALVTAPVNKASIIRAGHPFVGQTEFLSELSGTSQTAMMLLGHDEQNRWLRVVLATTHVPLQLVASHLTTEKVDLAIRLAEQACADLQLRRSRIGVCALNPHAGEGGQLGTEEGELIEPAVVKARERGIDVSGPFAADSLFHRAYRGEYDAIVTMYHDQGLIPLKMVAFENGVNWTLGLPFIRTSPDHGTAYDIAGHNQADPSSMVSAIRLAKKLALRSSGTARK